MAIVETPTGLDSGGTTPWPGQGARVGVDLYNGRTIDYAALYRAQPNVRLCVRFLGRSIGQLGLHGFRKLEAAHRERLPDDHEVSQLLASPFSAAPKPPTRHRWVRTMVEDLATFDRYFALKVRNPASGRLNVVRLMPQQVRVEGSSILGPTAYCVRNDRGQERPVDPADMVHIWGHDPANPSDGVSPLEALRRILAEDISAGDWRFDYWRNSARIAGVIERPVTAPKWGDPARDRFLEDWRATWSAGSDHAGGTPILEEGMKFVPHAFNAEQSQYLEARRLTREEAAAVFYIPPVFVGLNEGLTFAQVKESKTLLYTETLGPWLDWITEELEAQVLPELADAGSTYLDFNIDAKLSGSFEEQAAVLSTAVGAPWMTRDEARARRNMPPLEDGEGAQVVTPLNVLVGGLASPRDTAPELGQVSRTGAGRKSLEPYLIGWEAKHAEVLAGFFETQKASVLSRLGAGSSLATAFDVDRWNGVLGDRLLAVAVGQAEELGAEVATALGGAFDVDRAMAYLSTSARIAAEQVNASTLAQLEQAAGAPRLADRDPGAKALEEVLAEVGALDLLDDDTPDDPTDVGPTFAAVFEASPVRAAQLARTRTTAVGSFARHEGAAQAGAGTKTWHAAAGSRHEDLDLETVPLGAAFSNGARWPGDPTQPTGDTAGCSCSLTFGQ